MAICNNARKVLKASKKDSSNQRNKASSTHSKSTKAGKVQTALLSDDDTDEADIIVTAKSADVIDTVDAVEVAFYVKSKGRDPNVDSGCSQSMTPHSDQLTVEKPSRTTVRLADDSIIKATHRGSLVRTIMPGKPHPTLLVPALHEPLLSVAGLADDGLLTVFDKNQVTIYDCSLVRITGSAVAVGDRRRNLYYLPEEVNASSALSCAARVDHSLFDWHQTFSHICIKPLKLLLKALNVQPTVLNATDVQQFSVCVQGKMHCLSFTSWSQHRATERGQIIHSDVCSFESVSREGFLMWTTFIDDYSKDVCVYPMKSKSHVFHLFKQYKATCPTSA